MSEPRRDGRSSAPTSPRRSRLVLLALGAVVAFAPLLAGCARTPEKTLLTVGSRHLTVDEFEEYGRDPQVISRYMMLPDSLQKKALFDDVESYEILAAAGQEKGFDKDSAYVHIEDATAPRLLQDALYDKHIGSVLKVSDDEARLFYDEAKVEYRLAVILVPDTVAVRNVTARLARGAPFASVAKTASSDPGTAQNGGEIPGWVTLMQFSPAAEAAIQPLKKGEHTGPVVDRTGVYVFAVLDTRPRQVSAPFEQVKEQIIQILQTRKKGVLVDRYIGDLRRQAGLKLDGAGWSVVDAKIVAAPDSLARYLGRDNARLGLSDADLKQPLATWDGKSYTVDRLTKDLIAAQPNERPQASHEEMFHQFVEGKVVTDILVAQAKKEGIDKTPAIKTQVERAKSAYLVQKYVADAIPPSKVGMPTPAELDSVTRALVNASMSQSAVGAHANIPTTFAAMPPQVQDQIANDWREKRQQALLKDEVARLKTRMPPVVDQRLYQSIPWPVPAAGRKENA